MINMINMKSSDGRLSSYWINILPKITLAILALTVLYLTTRSCTLTTGDVHLKETDQPRSVGSLYKNKFNLKSKYPLTDPIPISGGLKYKIGMISDMDKDRSKVPGKPLHWRSFFKTGYLVQDNHGYRVEFGKSYNVTTTLNEKGRGLELSELCVFNDKLYTADDRTGVVFHLVDNKPIPWVILQDGDGNDQKGFKCEWMTVKDGLLYVGSSGKERTSEKGDYENSNPMYVKTITPAGEVTHLDWAEHYKAIRRKVGIEFPGYMWHEGVMWSERKRKWFFIPRRMSKMKYDDKLDETRGANVVLTASQDFSEIGLVYIGDPDRTHGYSSFKFIPGTKDNLVVALRTKELDDEVSSYIMVIEVDTGEVLMHEQLVGDEKYEGIEFL